MAQAHGKTCQCLFFPIFTYFSVLTLKIVDFKAAGDILGGCQHLAALLFLVADPYTCFFCSSALGTCAEFRMT